MVEKKLRSPETLKQWNATRKKIEEFLVNQFQLKNIELAAIEYSFAVKFYNYLTIEREKALGEAAAKKQVKNLKEILTFAETSTWVAKNPIIKFKCGGGETDIPPLEYFEVEAIWNKKINIQRLAEVRDAFIFQCFTGFAFQVADIEKSVVTPGAIALKLTNLSLFTTRDMNYKKNEEYFIIANPGIRHPGCACPG
jgi:hypothetical protein